MNLDPMGLNAIKEAIENRARKSFPTTDILKIVEFVLKNNYFEFNGNVKQQLSGTAIGTRCAPSFKSILNPSFIVRLYV